MKLVMRPLLVLGLLLATVEGGTVSNALIIAEEQVSLMMSDLRAAYAHGELTRCDVARAAVEKSEQANDWAQRFVFLKGALIMYCQGGDFASAEKTYVALTNAQDWLTVELRNCVLDLALRGISDNRAARLGMLVDKNIGLMMIEDLSLKLRSDPENVLLHRKLGEQYAIQGDWEKALVHFKSSGGEFARVAAQELAPEGVDWKELGDFWWLASDDKADLLHEEYRIHARALYKKSMRLQPKE